MEPVVKPNQQKYSVIVDDLGDFDLDDDRSIAPSIEFALKQGGITDAVVDQHEFNRAAVEVSTSHTADEVEKALQQDELHAEVHIMEQKEIENVNTGPGHFKQDDFTTSVKKSKKFKYVNPRHGDNSLADEDKQTNDKAVNEKAEAMLKEYREFVSESSKTV
jgi:hypothetical protein